MLYVPLPLLLWAALRFGTGAVSVSLLFFAFMVIWNTANGRGPFAGYAPTSSIFALQVFLTLLSAPSLLLAALLQERRRAADTLAEREARVPEHLRVDQRRRPHHRPRSRGRRREPRVLQAHRLRPRQAAGDAPPSLLPPRRSAPLRRVPRAGQHQRGDHHPGDVRARGRGPVAVRDPRTALQLRRARPRAVGGPRGHRARARLPGARATRDRADARAVDAARDLEDRRVDAGAAAARAGGARAAPDHREVHGSDDPRARERRRRSDHPRSPGAARPRGGGDRAGPRRGARRLPHVDAGNPHRAGRSVGRQPRRQSVPGGHTRRG